MRRLLMVASAALMVMTGRAEDGAGVPSRDPQLDVLPGFKNPPPGYGEVPYWWWTGGNLDPDRMIVQLKELRKKGISGVQVNYSHYDTSGWLTDQDKPEIFTEDWWKVYSRISEACAELGMGIGMSTYTIDWPRGAPNLFNRLFYSKPELNALELGGGRQPRLRGGQTKTFDCGSDHIAAHAYPVVGGKVQRGGVDLTPLAKDGKVTWTAPDGEWEVWVFRSRRHAGSLNPLMAGSGEMVIRDFFQPFQDHNPGKSSKGLNYFFNDELQIGVGKFAWHPDFAAEFRKRKGYDLFEVLPAMWDDMGGITPKVRMDYADVRMALMEERYFKPIYAWHASRGMIYACDSGGRGTDPHEFGDYFRVTRWYSAPGHDTPGGSADLIKGKVSSSVADLYQRPRVNPPPKDERPVRQRTLPMGWTVAFAPTMDNTYGDFRMPVTAENKTIGLEARRFAWGRETEALAKTAMLPATDDRAWPKQLHGFGPQFYVLGPLPDDTDPAALDAVLAKLMSLDPSQPVSVSGKAFTWIPYDFSWRMGKEGDSGHQGYHGLKRTVTDDFLCVGQPASGLNETRYNPDKAGKMYYLWTSATVEQAVTASIEVSRTPPADKSHTSTIITPAALYVNGTRIADLAQPLPLKAGANPVLVRYDHAGRGHLVMRRQGAPAAQARTPLAMRWYDDPGVIPFDVQAGKPAAEWFRFLSAPGTMALRVQARGKVEAWLDGEPMADKGDGRFAAAKTLARAPVVALRVTPETGRSGGSAIPEPVAVETDGTGVMALGDWSRIGILNNYSGGVRYSIVFGLTEEEAAGKVELDLGSVIATAEIRVNGKPVAVLVAPPWKTELAGVLKSGDNTLEVLVYNTLANHYQTIPSNYRGSPTSGLLGPVCLRSRDWKQGETPANETQKRGTISAVAPESKVISTVGDVRVMVATESLDAFNGRIGAAGNLMRVSGLIASAIGQRGHDGGGRDFAALFNGTAGNKKGGEQTENDGGTFVGMGEGNILDLIFDPAKAPKGVAVQTIRTYAGHGDARASQRYTIFVARVAAPDQFVQLAEVAHDAPGGGLNEVTIETVSRAALADGVRGLRFVFKNGPVGFNVYREIAVFGQVQPPK